MAVQHHRLPGSPAEGAWPSRRTARTRTAGPNRTTAVSSRTPAAGADVITRRTCGRWPLVRLGPSCRIRRRVCSVVQGVSCCAGREPASVSARTCANWLGQAPPGLGPMSARARPRVSPGRGLDPAPAAVGGTVAVGLIGGSPVLSASSSYGGAGSGTAVRLTATASGSGARRPGRRTRVGSIGTTAGRRDLRCGST